MAIAGTALDAVKIAFEVALCSRVLASAGIGRIGLGFLWWRRERNEKKDGGERETRLRCQCWLHKKNNVEIAAVAMFIMILISVFMIMLMVKIAILTIMILLISTMMIMINKMEKSKT